MLITIRVKKRKYVTYTRNNELSIQHKIEKKKQNECKERGEINEIRDKNKIEPIQPKVTSLAKSMKLINFWKDRLRKREDTNNKIRNEKRDIITDAIDTTKM